MTTIELRNVSRWYGNVVAVNDVTMDIAQALPVSSARTARASPRSCT
jgi:ABC-type branched-subunit amino acid transport system ATPase component